MKRIRMSTGIGAAIGMLLLILDSKTALEGAAGGIDLCLKTVIPSLFPFFVLSILLTGAFTGQDIPLLRPLGRLFGVCPGAESILLSGFLGGYPVGAQSIQNACASGALDKAEGERMLAFCNNAGPAFLFGMAAALFPRAWMAWALWAIQIASAWLVSRLFPSKSDAAIRLASSKTVSLTDAVSAAVRVMAGVCGWVVLFRVVLTFLNRWIFWILPATAQIILAGFLELSNGCCSLISVNNLGLRFLLCSGMLSFGGLCVGMQTWSAAPDLSKRLYFPGKIIQTCFSLLFALGVQTLFPADFRLVDAPWLLILALAVPAAVILFRKREKSSSNPALLGV